ncbi:exodeoxyribonuclease V subunit gamma [Conexibacter woesei]|uniref:RecBCD enzyme subunit RecC n=1 Tax=Conexibacter woesei (strain DSM 14684 / CCUG 47730 / CIP 108061 / JCM 11494 / NBRC 100937 / ID131577) TaxID=469383 RepID=D3FF73_CONWI|nr:exodeoxyribonuclease V subunit gamma [Conexibacter woesei]ADB51790.1 exodeoxyribonuclease V, gamma subunit [Conexibacter woesei DSM 14684]
MLHVHHADGADRLVAALAEVLTVRLADPFAAEVVAVPTRGVERWLAQRLSGRLGTSPGAGDGICANVAFPTPRRVVEEAIAAASGLDAATDPWRPERALWPLLELVDAASDEAWLGRLTAHLDRAAGDRSRRLSAVRHVATLFARYALHRPAMLRAWAAGSDEDGAGGALDAEHRWQAELWRRLRERVGVPGPAELLDLGRARLVEDPGLSDLPERISLFGLTSLPARDLQLLRALAERRDVHLFLLMPSPAAWRGIADAAGRGPILTRGQALSAALPAHPLLASWGRDGRELQLLLEPLPTEAVHADAIGAGDEPDTLLARVQADIRADRTPREDEPVQLGDGDASVQVHVCHGRARQVEVLRDAILHALADDPSLEPRDVIVMCPDIETFAPLVEATFGAGEADVGEALADDAVDLSGAHPAELRVRLADRSLRQTNPVLGVVTKLLELATARVTASELLDLVDREPVRRRFRLEEDELARVEDWVAASGIRWGLDAAHRAPFRLQHVPQGTWAAGLDRLLTGVAMAERPGHTLAGVLPLDDVDSSAIDLAGRFAELLDRLAAALDELAAPKPISAWATAIAEAADTMTATTPRDAWQRAELQQLLADVVEEATNDGVASAVSLDVADVAALLGGRLAGRPTRTNFRTGHLTVCTLQPMRSVPHRVICLLGLDDDVFPRRSPRDGDDVLLDEPWIGDRDGRSEDRQILLDALMAAGDRLIVTYSGRSERTNAERAPAVPIGELLDVIDRTACAADGGRARDAVLVRHPLQPFDAANFAPSTLVPQRAWSFDGVTLEGARALGGERGSRPPFLPRPLQPQDADVIELDQLLAFVGHPVRAFLRQRLGVGVDVGAGERSDSLPIELDPLARWGLGARLLAARRAGVDVGVAVADERARGSVPPGALGDQVLRGVVAEVEAILGAAAETVGAGGPLRTLDVRIALEDGRTLAGTIGGVGQYVLPVVTYSRVDPRRRMESWVRLLALTAAFPERSLVATTVGRARRDVDRATTIARIAQPGGEPDVRRTRAHAELARIVDLYDRGMREPLPLFRQTSAAYAAGGATAVARAHTAWETDFQPLREDLDPEHQLVFGGTLPFERLLAEAPRDDEQGEDWDMSEPSRFGRYARRLWSGLLAHEELIDR